jgi:phosphatidate phosphatase APP1
MKFSLPALLLFLGFAFKAQAQIMVVSDVDDTIKVSHVLDKDSTLANGPLIHNAFLGMPELYHAIVEHPQMLTLKYLSNAPKRFIGDIHQKFLRANHFPKGELVTRRWRQIFSGNNHKLDSLRSFIKEHQPREMILIGDNGEADTEIYAQIRREFPQITGPTYIRVAYSMIARREQGKPLLPGQTGFASSIDVALDLLNRGYLKMEAVEELVKATVPELLSEGSREERGHPIAFPAWYDCRDFAQPELPTLVDVDAHELLQRYGVKMNKRCSIPAIEY